MADRHQSGVIISAIANILEHVLAFRERCFAHPVGAFATHMCRALGLAAGHELRQPMATDTGIAARAFGQDRRRIMRAAGTEIWNARHEIGLVARRRGGLQCRGTGRNGAVPDAFGHGQRDLVRLQHAMRREQRLALLIGLADDNRALVIRIQNILDLGFDQRALFLHHDDGREARGKIRDDRRFERPHHAELQQPDTKLCRLRLVDPEVIQRLAHIEIGLARRDDAKPRRLSTLHDDAVDGIGPGEGFHRGHLVHMQAFFLRHAIITRADVKPIRGQHVISRSNRLDALKSGLDDSGGLDRIMNAFHADPDAGITRQGKTHESEIDDLLNACR